MLIKPKINVMGCFAAFMTQKLLSRTDSAFSDLLANMYCSPVSALMEMYFVVQIPVFLVFFVENRIYFGDMSTQMLYQIG